MNYVSLLGVTTWPPHPYTGAPTLLSILAFLAVLLGLLWVLDHFFGRYIRRYL